MTTLLDANVLIALLLTKHVHHSAAEAWFTQTDGFATCPSTQSSLVRMLLREGQSAHVAQSAIKSLSADDRHSFWADALSYSAVQLTGVLGHRQVTDAYLAQLARHHKGRLATFDQGLAKLHTDVVDLVPVDR